MSSILIFFSLNPIKKVVFGKKFFWGDMQCSINGVYFSSNAIYFEAVYLKKKNIRYCQKVLKFFFLLVKMGQRAAVTIF